MGVYLSNEAGEFSLSHHGWSQLLLLAHTNGWEPLGTKAPNLPDEMEYVGEWEGGYTSNDFQTVTDEDASNLVKALVQALPDIPNEDVVAHKRRSLSAEMTPLEYFSGRKRVVRAFIKFCRGKGFMIA